MDDLEFLPISLLSQYFYCKRRAGFLMLEQAWSDNSFTVEGTVQHKIVHSPGIEHRGKKIKIFEMSVHSKQLGLLGKCDCIEGEEDDNGVFLPDCGKKYRLFPVEYKHGVVRNEIEYNIQLCAQAMCIEEMFGITLDKGAIFYINSHRRDEVCLDNELRDLVKAGIEQLKMLGKIPSAEYSSKCKKCSLIDLCMPQLSGTSAKYMEKLRKEFSEYNI